MRSALILFIMLISVLTVWAEEKPANNDLTNNLQRLQETVKTMQKEQNRINAEIKKQNVRISELGSMIREKAVLTQKSLSNVEDSSRDAHTKIQNVNDSLSKRTRQWMIGILLVAAISVSLYIVLRRSAQSSNVAMEALIKKTHAELEAEGLRIDSKLVELLERQRAVIGNADSSDSGKDDKKEMDHSLPLRVSEEIYRMRKRLSGLPIEIKGLKPLLKSLERLEDDLNQQGYELVEMAGMKYNENMNVKARFIPSDDLNKGENIVSKVIKPQINFNGVAIQIAEIEVSSGG